MTDIHCLGGRTMSAGEAALRRKMKALATELDARPDLGSGYAANQIREVLTGQYDTGGIDGN